MPENNNPTGKDRMVAAGRVRFKATQELVRRHLGEFEEIHGDYREEAGLPRELIGSSSSQTVTARYERPRIDPLLTIAQVAQVLGVSRATVYRLIDRGELTPIRVHSDARFAQGDVADLIERSREPAAVAGRKDA